VIRTGLSRAHAVAQIKRFVMHAKSPAASLKRPSRRRRPSWMGAR